MNNATFHALRFVDGSDSILRDGNVSELGVPHAHLKYPLPLATFLGMVMGLISLATVVLNGLTIVAFTTHKRLRTYSDYLILNLAVSDFCVGLVSMPFYIPFTLTGTWLAGEGLCLFWLAWDYTAAGSTTLNIAVIAIDRYLLVTHPVNYLRWKNRRLLLLMLLVPWALTGLLYVPSIIVWRLLIALDGLKPGHCHSPFHHSFEFSFFSLLVQFIVPLVLLVVINILIYLQIQRRHKGFKLLSKSVVSTTSTAGRKSKVSVPAPQSRQASWTATLLELDGLSISSVSISEADSSSVDLQQWAAGRSLPPRPGSASVDGAPPVRVEDIEPATSTDFHEHSVNIFTGETHLPQTATETFDPRPPLYRQISVRSEEGEENGPKDRSGSAGRSTDSLKESSALHIGKSASATQEETRNFLVHKLMRAWTLTMGSMDHSEQSSAGNVHNPHSNPEASGVDGPTSTTSSQEQRKTLPSRSWPNQETLQESSHLVGVILAVIPEISGKDSYRGTQSGLVSTHATQSGLVLTQSGLVSTPATQSGLVSTPATQSGLVSTPATQSGLVSTPVTQSGLVPPPATQFGLVSTPATPSDLVSTHATPSGLVSTQSGLVSTHGEPQDRQTPVTDSATNNNEDKPEPDDILEHSVDTCEPSLPAECYNAASSQPEEAVSKDRGAGSSQSAVLVSGNCQPQGNNPALVVKEGSQTKDHSASPIPESEGELKTGGGVLTPSTLLHGPELTPRRSVLQKGPGRGQAQRSPLRISFLATEPPAEAREQCPQLGAQGQTDGGSVPTPSSAQTDGEGERKVSTPLSGSSLQKKETTETFEENRSVYLNSSARLIARTRSQRKVARHAQRKGARALFVMVLVFAVCWLPFELHSLLATVGEGKYKIPRAAVDFFTWLLWVNSTFNPILYPLLYKRYRYAYFDTLAKLSCRRSS